MAKKQTTEQFKKEVYNLVKDEYEVLGEYINANTKIEMRHNKCGHIYTVTPNKFKSKGTRCPKCFKSKKKTTEIFKQEVYDLVGYEYLVLGEYINARTKIDMKHNTCGHIYSVTPSKFLAERRCPECAKKTRGDKRRKTTEEFKKEVFNLIGDEYTVLGEYIGANTKIEMKHNVCGNIYPVTPNSFLSQGSRCSECFGSKKKNTDTFKKEVFDLVGDEYTVLGEYINAKTYIEMQHNICGKTYSIIPDTFIRGTRCGDCSIKIRSEKTRKTTEEFKKEVFNLIGDEYTVLGEYIGANNHIKVRHNTCGGVYTIKASHLLGGTACRNCSIKIRSEKRRKTTEEFKKEVFDVVEHEYSVLGEYLGADKHIKMQHNICGNIYPVAPSKFLRGRRCPRCNVLKGEDCIIKFLDKYNINYKHDKPYGGCSYRAQLRFDFLIYDDNDNLKLICEYDGEQHFEPIERFGGEEEFKDTQIRDNIKNDFCKENNIPLLRIPYWEFDNIHKILGKKLYKLDLI